jgi:hypothetical protein
LGCRLLVSQSLMDILFRKNTCCLCFFWRPCLCWCPCCPVPGNLWCIAGSSAVAGVPAIADVPCLASVLIIVDFPSLCPYYCLGTFCCCCCWCPDVAGLHTGAVVHNVTGSPSPCCLYIIGGPTLTGIPAVLAVPAFSGVPTPNCCWYSFFTSYCWWYSCHCWHPCCCWQLASMLLQASLL